MRIDLTADEVREVGAGRWTERMKWRLLAGLAFVTIFPPLLIVYVLHESSSVIHVAPCVLCLLWFFWRRDRKGKAFLRQVQQDEGSTDDGGLVK